MKFKVSDFLVPISQVLGLQACAAMTALKKLWIITLKGFTYLAKQALLPAALQFQPLNLVIFAYPTSSPLLLLNL